jgi:hypothetical protein
MASDYLIEKKLKNEAPGLHRMAADTQAVLTQTLQSYRAVFPDYTDHSILHSLDVLNYCNHLIGEDQIDKVNADECYVLMMACFLHDIGMGVKEKDFFEFMEELEGPDFAKKLKLSEIPVVTRDHHHELSGLYIRKYAAIFDIPSEDHLFAIIQTSRGHRKTDLYDEKEYPDIELPNGNVIRTAYLAALIRLSDEIDVASDRNPEILYDINNVHDAYSRLCFEMHRIIKEVEISEDAVVLYTTDVPDVFMDFFNETVDKIEQTLGYCEAVVRTRTPFELHQKHVVCRKR